MSHRVLKLVGVLCIAPWLVAAPVSPIVLSALAQSADSKPADPQSPAAQDTGVQKPDEFAEAQRILSGPAGNGPGRGPTATLGARTTWRPSNLPLTACMGRTSGPIC